VAKKGGRKASANERAVTTRRKRPHDVNSSQVAIDSKLKAEGGHVGELEGRREEERTRLVQMLRR
jgi:hypothetical protein